MERGDPAQDSPRFFLATSLICDQWCVATDEKALCPLIAAIPGVPAGCKLSRALITSPMSRSLGNISGGLV